MRKSRTQLSDWTELKIHLYSLWWIGVWIINILCWVDGIFLIDSQKSLYIEATDTLEYELQIFSPIHLYFHFVMIFAMQSERAMAPYSSTLAWKIPWMEGPGGLQSMGSLSQTRLSDFTFTFHFHALEKEMATHSSVLAWRIQGWGSLVGCHLWGRRVRHDWSDLAAAAANVGWR